MQEQKSNLVIPASILLAGFIIAVGIYLSNKSDNPNQVINEVSNNESLVRPVSKEDHIRGNPDASVVVIEYGDTECPPCKMFHSVMTKIIDNYGKSGKVSWVFRHAPIERLHSRALKEAEATECAASLGGEKMFWTYIDKIYEVTPGNNELDPAELPKIATSLGLDETKFNKCLSTGATKSIVDADLADLIKITNGRPGTPHLEILLKNELTDSQMVNIVRSFGSDIDIKSNKKNISVTGAYQYEAFKVLIDYILE